ncbi:DUF4920 domain-containing protein [Aurantibacter crassamenti]|uniref:DUF4920 domain-containing protein n=1 Tax=Aurantibacter crassamenti TaxID=1837375 RepID=UPI00193A2DE2|nr:DUF4920 domain-containing protein [Aurantibacter crassamenti]MBM1106353.1 DUF4920 domain-containing protein [Aurantibacter crassamenti]
MYRFSLLTALLFAVNFCTSQEIKSKSDSEVKTQKLYESFGEKTEAANTISSIDMLKEYANLQTSDSLKTKFTAKVLDVCKVKGCWMRLELDNGEEAMVKFKNYGFFMPFDITGKEVIVNGSAFVNEMSVAEQKHYAEDGGKSKEEIAKITAAKKTYGFLADGVLLKK